MRKLIAIVLAISMMSCGVYKGKSVSLETAVASERPIKVKTINGERVTYTKVYKTDGQFYGVKAVNNKGDIVPLNPEDIEGVYIKSRSGTAIVSGFLGLTAGVILLNAIYNEDL